MFKKIISLSALSLVLSSVLIGCGCSNSSITEETTITPTTIVEESTTIETTIVTTTEPETTTVLETTEYETPTEKEYALGGEPVTVYSKNNPKVEYTEPTYQYFDENGNSIISIQDYPQSVTQAPKSDK